MKTSSSSTTSSHDLMQQITARIEDLARATDAAQMSDEMQRYLDTFARFHRYSVCNTWLILLARPDATLVAGFHAWVKMHRFVRRGEHGIRVLAPIVVKGEDEQEVEGRVLRGFKVVHVFDIAQTDGEPLPEPPCWKSPEMNTLLQDRLLAFAKDRGITVTEKALEGETQGVSKGGSIELSPMAGTATLIHEVAHELMHKGKDAPAERSVRELEAEAVCYAVGTHFGLDVGGAPSYVSLHGATAAMVLAHLERIRRVAMLLIEYMDAEQSPSDNGTTILSRAHS